MFPAHVGHSGVYNSAMRLKRNRGEVHYEGGWNNVRNAWFVHCDANCVFCAVNVESEWHFFFPMQCWVDARAWHIIQHLL